MNEISTLNPLPISLEQVAVVPPDDEPYRFYPGYDPTRHDEVQQLYRLAETTPEVRAMLDPNIPSLRFTHTTDSPATAESIMVHGFGQRQSVNPGRDFSSTAYEILTTGAPDQLGEALSEADAWRQNLYTAASRHRGGSATIFLELPHYNPATRIAMRNNEDLDGLEEIINTCIVPSRTNRPLLPAQFVRGYVDHETGEYHANPHFRPEPLAEGTYTYADIVEEDRAQGLQ